MSKRRSGTQNDLVTRHQAHYLTDMGSMPEALVQLAHYAPEAFDGYSTMRTGLLKSEAEGAKLPLKYKHLIIAVLDAIRDEPIGVINHTRAAMLAGLTREEVVEGMLCGIIVYGMPAWGKVGRKAVDFAVEFEKELAKKAKRGGAKAKAAKASKLQAAKASKAKAAKARKGKATKASKSQAAKPAKAARRART